MGNLAMPKAVAFDKALGEAELVEALVDAEGVAMGGALGEADGASLSETLGDTLGGSLGASRFYAERLALGLTLGWTVLVGLSLSVPLGVVEWSQSRLLGKMKLQYSCWDDDIDWKDR